MKRIVILMYHALYEGEQDLADIPAADRPYAVSVADFEAQLDTLTEDGLEIIDPGNLTGGTPQGPGLIVTFDDGHRSSFRHAFPILAKRGHKAAFFVTTDFIESRADCCDWGELREMAGAGMLIGAHGRTHRFFDDLDGAAASAEFLQSRSAIEEHLGTEVAQMSFPGGRFNSRLLSIGTASGYRIFHSSRVGLQPAGFVAPGAVLPRIAVRRDMSLDQFRMLANGRRISLLKLQTLAHAKQCARRIAGNRLYHHLYERYSA